MEGEIEEKSSMEWGWLLLNHVFTQSTHNKINIWVLMWRTIAVSVPATCSGSIVERTIDSETLECVSLCRDLTWPLCVICFNSVHFQLTLKMKIIISLTHWKISSTETAWWKNGRPHTHAHTHPRKVKSKKKNGSQLLESNQIKTGWKNTEASNSNVITWIWWPVPQIVDFSERFQLSESEGAVALRWSLLLRG